MVLHSARGKTPSIKPPRCPRLEEGPSCCFLLFCSSKVLSSHPLTVTPQHFQIPPPLSCLTVGNLTWPEKVLRRSHLAITEPTWNRDTMHRPSGSLSSTETVPGQQVYSEKPIVLQIVDSHPDPDLQTEAYGPSGFAGLFASSHVAVCAVISAIGGLLFGYDQGIISVILTMDHFLERFPEVAETASGAGFLKGLMTAMITLGAAFGKSR